MGFIFEVALFDIEIMAKRQQIERNFVLIDIGMLLIGFSLVQLSINSSPLGAHISYKCNQISVVLGCLLA